MSHGARGDPTDSHGTLQRLLDGRARRTRHRYQGHHGKMLNQNSSPSRIARNPNSIPQPKRIPFSSLSGGSTVCPLPSNYIYLTQNVALDYGTLMGAPRL